MIAGASRRMHAGSFTELGTPVEDDRTQPDGPDGPPDVAHVVSVARERAVTTRALAPQPAGPTRAAGGPATTLSPAPARQFDRMVAASPKISTAASTMSDGPAVSWPGRCIRVA
jgi:hypothetical protein